jgi:tryptophan-rich sensory protein
VVQRSYASPLCLTTCSLLVQSLSFPPGRPPGWAFPVVWTTLYASMGYASYLATVALQSAEAVDRPRYVTCAVPRHACSMFTGL